MIRLLGLILFIKSLIPIVVVMILLYATISTAIPVNRIITQTQAKINPEIERIEAELANIEKEGRRLYDEINKIQNKTRELTDEVKRSIEPIRKSLLGLTGIVRTISRTMETILNTIIRAINHVPRVNIKKVNLPNIKVPGLVLPDIDLGDLNLNPDLQAIEELQLHAHVMTTEIDRAVKDIKSTLQSLWNTILLIVVLTVVWLVLTLILYCFKVYQRLAYSIRMMRGERVDVVWQGF